MYGVGDALTGVWAQINQLFSSLFVLTFFALFLGLGLLSLIAEQIGGVFQTAARDVRRSDPLARAGAQLSVVQAGSGIVALRPQDLDDLAAAGWVDYATLAKRRLVHFDDDGNVDAVTGPVNFEAVTNSVQFSEQLRRLRQSRK